jgi:choline dehydrogenase-like flavoprotein
MPSYDYVIVGAGSAGCVLANRLSADGVTTVALIEAGGPDKKMEIHIPAAFSKLFKTAYDWDYATTPQKHMDDRSLYWPRGKVLGGSSSINAQMWVRGTRADYDAWDLPGWSYDDVLPYFHRIERRIGSNNGGVYGTDGPLYIEELRDPNPLTAAFLDACGEAGLKRLGELNEEAQLGFAPTPVTQHRGRRWSCVDAYLKPARSRKNLTVITGGLVTAIALSSSDTPRATGIAYRTASGESAVITASREVIVSAGAIGSPQLLQLSGIGDPAALSDVGVTPVVAAPNVGKHLQDHLVAGWIRHTPTPVSLVDAEKPAQLVKYLLGKKGMLSSNVAEAVAMIATQPGLTAPDIELIFAATPFLDHGFTQPPGHGLTIGCILLQPHSSGSVSLASASPLDAPLIDAGYLADDRDVRTLYDGMQFAHSLFETAALAPHTGDYMRPDHFPTDEADAESMMRAYAETLYHPTGTCRMGTDSESVVDESLRVRGVDGLRVVDASVLPQIIRGHTHAPAVMIAEKAADLIRS